MAGTGKAVARTVADSIAFKFFFIFWLILCPMTQFSVSGADMVRIRKLKSVMSTAIRESARDNRNPKLLKQWTKKKLDLAAKLIYYMGYKYYGLPLHHSLALIEIESDFNLYSKSRRNKDGTYDYGLTQQNSSFIQERFRKMKSWLKKGKYSGKVRKLIKSFYKKRRKLKYWDYFRLKVSIPLMYFTLMGECRYLLYRGKYWYSKKYDRLWLCYNNPRLSMRIKKLFSSVYLNKMLTARKKFYNLLEF